MSTLYHGPTIGIGSGACLRGVVTAPAVIGMSSKLPSDTAKDEDFPLDVNRPIMFKQR